MVYGEAIGPVESKQNRLDVLESLRVLSPENTAELARVARQLIESQNTEKGESVDG